MSAGHTPGPWAWFGSYSGGVDLATTHSGRKYVMGFQRYGMNGAQPNFRCGDRMVPAADLVEFQVGDGTVRGFKQAKTDGSIYRYDVSGIDNADARLIAASPVMFEALLWVFNNTDENSVHHGVARAAIAKATGQEGGAL